MSQCSTNTKHYTVTVKAVLYLEEGCFFPSLTLQVVSFTSNASWKCCGLPTPASTLMCRHAIWVRWAILRAWERQKYYMKATAHIEPIHLAHVILITCLKTEWIQLTKTSVWTTNAKPLVPDAAMRCKYFSMLLTNKTKSIKLLSQTWVSFNLGKTANVEEKTTDNKQERGDWLSSWTRALTSLSNQWTMTTLATVRYKFQFFLEPCLPMSFSSACLFFLN